MSGRAQATVGQVDRSQPPPPGELAPFHFPRFERHTLDNGLSVYLASATYTPLIQLDLMVPAGAQWQPLATPGLATLVADLLDEGTANRSAIDIALEVERLGGYLSTSADWSSANLSTSLLTADRGAGLELLADVVTAPSFEPAEIERLRRRRLAELQQRRAQPAAVAADLFCHALYDGTVYGHPLAGAEESVRRLDRDQIAGFYERCYGPAGATLVAVGDFEPARLLDDIDARLGTWQGAAPVTAPAVQTPEHDGARVLIADLPRAAQTELCLGHPGLPRAHPDWVPTQVLNSLLGGKFTSRINLNLRERQGFTYGASSRFAARLGPGPFEVSTAVANEVTGRAVDEVRAEIRRLREETAAAEEIADTKTFLLGTFPNALQRIDGLARLLGILAVHGLPDDGWDRHLERAAAVDAAEVRSMAERHLHPDRLAIVAAGPAAVLAPQLEHLGPVEVLTG